MFSRNLFSLAVVVVVGLLVVGLPVDRESTTESVESTPAADQVIAEKGIAGQEIKSLQIARRTVLQDRVKAVRMEYETGRQEVSFLLDAEVDFWRAELDLLTNKKTRIAAHEKLVENMARTERFAKLNLESGTGTVQQQLAAKAAWLDAKIALLEEQAK